MIVSKCDIAVVNSLYNNMDEILRSTKVKVCLES